MCHPVYYKIQKGTMVSSPFEKGGKSPLVSKESLTGRCFVSAISPDGTRTASTISERPSLEGLTGYVVFETHGGSRLSDHWQQKTETRLSRVHVTPRKTLFLAMLRWSCHCCHRGQPGRTTLTWTPLHDVSRQGCESTLLVPRSCDRRSAESM